MDPSSIESLRAALKDIDRIRNETWMHGLGERKAKELAFHDRNRNRDAIAQMDSDTYERFYGNIKYYSATEDSKRFVERWISSKAAGRVFLDYACGNGANAVLAAKAGAALSIGIDISAVSIRNAREDAREAGVEDRCVFVQADAEATRLPDRCIDVAICSGVLHHLDLSFAFPELRRILAPGGVILGVEALDYNPAIKLYRALTPEMRTEWEKAHILSLRDLRFAAHFFEVGGVRYWHILGILSPHLPFLSPILRSIDRVATRIPLIRLLAWMFTFELTSLEGAARR